MSFISLEVQYYFQSFDDSILQQILILWVLEVLPVCFFAIIYMPVTRLKILESAESQSLA